MPQIIDRFEDQYRFLSNFWPCGVDYMGVIYPTLEHAYVASKTKEEHHRKIILNLRTPGQAKRYGRNQIILRPDWNNVKLEIMLNLVRRKFNNNEDLKLRLLDTGDAILIEGNQHGDDFWGVCNNVGENNLGKILMKVRDEL